MEAPHREQKWPFRSSSRRGQEGSTSSGRPTSTSGSTGIVPEQFLSVITTLIVTQDWCKLREVLAYYRKKEEALNRRVKEGDGNDDSDDDADNIKNGSSSSSSSLDLSIPNIICNEQTSENILHITCRSHPPLDIVKLLVDTYPESVFACDKMDQFPLHAAAKFGASSAVIRFLIDANPRASQLQDCMGKTPLHLVCENYVRAYKPRKEGNVPLKDSMLDVTKALSKAAPGSVNIEDMDEMSPLEYAIESDADIKVIKSLQKACEKDWKARRTNGAKHAEVEEGLQRQGSGIRGGLIMDGHNSMPEIGPGRRRGGLLVGGNNSLSDMNSSLRALTMAGGVDNTGQSTAAENGSAGTGARRGGAVILSARRPELEPKRKKKTSARALLA